MLAGAACHPIGLHLYLSAETEHRRGMPWAQRFDPFWVDGGTLTFLPATGCEGKPEASLTHPPDANRFSHAIGATGHPGGYGAQNGRTP